MIEYGEGMTTDGEQLLEHFDKVTKDLKIAENGGYTPPGSDPRKCEPASPGNKGGFEYRVEHEQMTPFDRCGVIACTVQEECTEAVIAELNK